MHIAHNVEFLCHTFSSYYDMVCKSYLIVEAYSVANCGQKALRDDVEGLLVIHVLMSVLSRIVHDRVEMC